MEEQKEQTAPPAEETEVIVIPQPSSEESEWPAPPPPPTPRNLLRTLAGKVPGLLARWRAVLADAPEALRERVRAALRGRALRRALWAEELRLFEDDYTRNYTPGLTKPPDVGRPFLLMPWRVRGGVVLAHGYMAAPLEVRALGEYLRRRGFAVLGVRLTGHGTSPEDLSNRTWEDWYRAVERGCALMEAITPKVAVAGFSTGGCLALIAASRLRDRVRAVVSVCAPLYVRDHGIHFVPSIVGISSLLKRIGIKRFQFDYVENHPENTHINYSRNPLKSVRELRAVMAETERALAGVAAPALIIQGSRDTTVHPDSGPDIFAKLGSAQKELTIFERGRHGIVNGEGSAEVFSRAAQFLEQVFSAAEPPPGPRPAPSETAAVVASGGGGEDLPKEGDAPQITSTG